MDMKFMAYRQYENVEVEAIAEREYNGKIFSDSEEVTRYIGDVDHIVFLADGNYITARYHDKYQIKNGFDALCGRLGGGIVDGVFYRTTNNKKEIKIRKIKTVNEPFDGRG